MTNDTGAVVWKADYKPFGEEQAITATTENYKMFVGKEKDKETGLYYFGARYMSDRIGRFTSVDPVGPVDEKTGKVDEKILTNPQKLNRYSYAINNPYRFVDPAGREVRLIARRFNIKERTKGQVYTLDRSQQRVVHTNLWESSHQTGKDFNEGAVLLHWIPSIQQINPED
ncbi:MAG: RHS repeat-associated core domain-containing protein [Nitrospirota bacterium]